MPGQAAGVLTGPTRHQQGVVGDLQVRFPFRPWTPIASRYGTARETCLRSPRHTSRAESLELLILAAEQFPEPLHDPLRLFLGDLDQFLAGLAMPPCTDHAALMPLQVSLERLVDDSAAGKSTASCQAAGIFAGAAGEQQRVIGNLFLRQGHFPASIFGISVAPGGVGTASKTSSSYCSKRSASSASR